MEQNVVQPVVQPPVLNRKYLLIIGVLLLLLGLGGGYLLGSKTVPKGQQADTMRELTSPTSVAINNPTETPNSPTLQPTKSTPSAPSVEVTKEFYTGYNNCIAHSEANGSNYGGKSRIEICGEQYKQYLTPSMYAVLKSYYSRPDDPFLCSQAYYDSFSIKDVTSNETSSKVIVLSSIDGSSGNSSNWFVLLTKSNNQWLLNEVQCPKL